ncbi:MAG: membrane protein insertion efficiency factor YidD [Patescibacteria group bacterium]
MKTILKFLITLYQHIFSPDTGLLRGLYLVRGACVMYPSCSEYMKIAIEKHGAVKGIWLGILRICRCHPLQKNLIDVP